ncbi:MAG TPA: hypothetical protein VNC81_07785, partial [Xanthobacteraceae bacterium]|nr:hypothetical protein [Xanthobacteraceae bacterium]
MFQLLRFASALPLLPSPIQRAKGFNVPRDGGQWRVRRRAMVARHPRWKVDVSITILSVARSENLQDPS